MRLKEIFRSIGKNEYDEEYEEKPQKDSSFSIGFFELKSGSDVEELLNTLHYSNTIALISSRHLKDNDELRNVIGKVKEASDARAGRIVGLPDKWFLAVPRGIDIMKKKEEEPKPSDDI